MANRTCTARIQLATLSFAGALLALAAPTPAAAQISDTVTISDAAANAQGVVAVNAAAGVFNEQLNSGLVVQSDDLAIGVQTATQILGFNEWGAPERGAGAPAPCD